MVNNVNYDEDGLQKEIENCKHLFYYSKEQLILEKKKMTNTVR